MSGFQIERGSVFPTDAASLPGHPQVWGPLVCLLPSRGEREWEGNSQLVNQPEVYQMDLLVTLPDSGLTLAGWLMVSSRYEVREKPVINFICPFTKRGE